MVYLDYQWSKWNCFKPILATKPFSLNVDFLLNVLLVMILLVLIRFYKFDFNDFDIIRKVLSRRI